MLKECRYIPKLETDRLILRKLLPDDAEDLRKWPGRDEVYTYWGRPASKGEKNPELLFADPRLNVRRKPTNDFLWGIELKKTREVIGPTNRCPGHGATARSGIPGKCLDMYSEKK